MDDYTPRSQQDELDVDDTAIDPLAIEEHEDITEVLHEDPADRRAVLEDNENPDLEQSEDTRELVEDNDQES